MCYFTVRTHFSTCTANKLLRSCRKNFKNAATVNDGFCIYKDISLKPALNTNLNTKLYETSGLLWGIWYGHAMIAADNQRCMS